MTAVLPAVSPAGSGPAPLLAVEGLVTGFGAHAVLHGVDVAVAPGEIAGIFGLNGAGKSVTMKVIAGLVPAWSGSVRLTGRDITGDSPERRVAHGLANVPQGRQVFAELTVEQNLRLGAYQLRRRDRSRYGPQLERVYERFPKLAERRHQVAGTMSGGEQASLAVARALMSDPQLLLVDEPSAGLAPLVVEELFGVLKELNADGLTILLVEQNVTFGLELVDTAHLMRGGRVVYSGASAALDRARVAAELGIGRLLGGHLVRRAPAAQAEQTPSAPADGATAGLVADHGTPAVGHRFALGSGEVAAEVSGAPDGRLVVGIPGLSANLRSFDVVFGALDRQRWRTLAFDPRGRGRSATTPPGTYGWPAHARDVLDMADALGHAQFDLVGWSFGTWVAMTVCRLAPGRVRRLVLVDGGGVPDAAAVVPVHAGLDRLGLVHPSRQGFFELLRSTGVYEPWDRWEALFDYELEDVDGGVRARSRPEACWEDERYRVANFSYDLWDAVQVPALLVRATEPIPGTEGHILTGADAERFRARVPGAQLVEVDAHHYTVGMHPDTARAVTAFLDRE
ncbi:MAG TPA: alpha/beta fold hydrolase [Acidimicrobiales bacterium]|nr:alpha/beta fold hydrolase [Acidimicrobiales bacterium]